MTWSRAESCRVAAPVARFIADYVEFRGVDANRVMDLWSTAGELLPELSAHLPASRYMGLCDSPDSAEAWTHRHPDIEWAAADPGGPALHMEAGADVIVGMPPWHWAPRRIHRTNPRGVQTLLTDDPANIAIIDACEKLTPGGLGFFIVGPGFLLRPGPRTVMARLAEFGLHIDGVIELPHGSIRPEHGVAQTLLVLSTTPQAQPLVGRQALDNEAFASLLRTQKWRDASLLQQA